MSFLYFVKEKEEVSLLIDIGSGSITVAFVIFSKNKVPRFLYSIEHSFSVADRPDKAKLLSSMGTLLDSILTVALKEGLGNKKIKRVAISFSSPWYFFKSKSISIREDKPFVITKAFLEDVLKKEENLFQSELEKENSEDAHKNFSIIEKTIIHFKINGYLLNNSIGKKTKSLDLVLYMSAITQNTLEKIVDLVSKHTHISRSNIVLNTFPLALYLTVRDNFADGGDFLLMDVAGEVTDLSLAKDDVISANSSFPLGKNYIFRQIAKTLNTSPEIVESSINMYISKKADSETANMMEKVLTDIEKEWAIYFEDALHELSTEMVLPRKVFITVDPDVAPIFIEFLKLSKADSTSVFRKNMSIVHVNTELLSSVYKVGPNIKINEFIVILADFHNKLSQNQ